jgi:hypothetical protein
LQLQEFSKTLDDLYESLKQGTDHSQSQTYYENAEDLSALRTRVSSDTAIDEEEDHDPDLFVESQTEPSKAIPKRGRRPLKDPRVEISA